MNGFGLLLTITEPPPAQEAEFNAWYDSEHIAERLALQCGGSSEAQAEAAFRLILLRDARERERTEFAAYIECYGLANAAQLLLNSISITIQDMIHVVVQWLSGTPKSSLTGKR